MLAVLDAEKDWPRSCHVCAAYDLDGKVYLGGDLDNEAEIIRRINKGSINQRNGYLSEYFHQRPDDPAVRGIVVGRLRHQAAELLEGELLSTTYPLINRGWVLAMYLVAQRNGDEEVMGLCVDIMRAVVALESYLECPADAHTTLRHRTASPGGRSGDRRGINQDRDQGRALETTGRPRFKWRPMSIANVELYMLRDSIDAGHLPKIKPAANLPRLRWPLTFRKFEHGHEAAFEGGMEGTIGPLYGVSVDYRLPAKPDGVRGGAVEWVGWDEFADAWKGTRPDGWDYPGGPMPRPLPSRDLGRLISERTIGGGGQTAPPPTDDDENEEPPVPPKPPQPNPPSDNALGSTNAPKRWLLHILDPETGDPKVLVMETSGPGRPMLAIREHVGR